MTLIRLKRYDEAIAELKKVLELGPNFLLAHDRLAAAYVLKGQYDEALKDGKEETRLNPGIGLGSLALVYAHMGNRTESMKILKELEQHRPAATSWRPPLPISTPP